MKVFLILVPIFVLVGLWLIIYSRRRGRLIKNFGTAKGLSYRPVDDGTLEQILNIAFALPAPLGRDFSRIRDIVEDGNVHMFRVTEGLDLSPYGMPQNTHAGRIAVYLDTGHDGELFFLAKNAQEIRYILPRETSPTDPEFEKMKDVILEFPPPHMLSVTVMGGKFLAYFEPTLTGSEKASDLDYLYNLATRVKSALS